MSMLIHYFFFVSLFKHLIQLTPFPFSISQAVSSVFHQLLASLSPFFRFFLTAQEEPYAFLSQF
jgi:hypothetical protein